MNNMNLPVQLTSFVGRTRDVANVIALLSNSHLVTLTGTGGGGKTRLAIQSADKLAATFADGVTLVDLAPVRDPAFVVQAVTQSLALHPPADQPLLETLLAYVRSRALLLVLDNCEHLSDACAQLVLELLSHSLNLRIIATSREPLAVSGETIYPVAGLDWPSERAALQASPQALMQFDAVRLFVDRARAILPNFELRPENVASVVEICRRLDGLPLALELASAHVNVLTTHEIAARLKDRFTFLISTRRNEREMRHPTLRATIDWSYDLLTVDEQILLRRVAVFASGWTLDTVAAIYATEKIAEDVIVDRISALVSKSLVMAETMGRVQARYRLLETIREYALEKLDEAGERSQMRDAHLDLFLARAEEAAPKLNDAYQQLWLNWLEGEHDNLRAALTWALESSRIEAGLRIASALVRFWEIRGNVAEGLTWFEHLLAQVDARVPIAVHATALAYASFIAMFRSDGTRAMAYGEQAVILAEATPDDRSDVLILALAGLASGARAIGDFQTAFRVEARAIQLLRDAPGQSFYLGMALLAHGGVAIELGDYDLARASLQESLALAQDAGDAFRIAHALNSLGDLARCEERYDDASALYEKSAAFLREIGAKHDLAAVLHNLGHASLHLGNVTRAHALFNEGMTIHQSLQNVHGMAECLVGMAAIALLRGSPIVSARLLSAAEVIGQTRIAAASVWHVTRMEYERYLELTRAALTEAEFLSAQQAGRAMSLAQALADVQNSLPTAEKAPEPTETVDSLTEREREVAALIGQGKTNLEIATELVVGKRTVETHVSRILAKLNLTHRGQIMLWSIAHGLTQTP